MGLHKIYYGIFRGLKQDYVTCERSLSYALLISYQFHTIIFLFTNGKKWWDIFEKKLRKRKKRARSYEHLALPKTESVILQSLLSSCIFILNDFCMMTKTGYMTDRLNPERDLILK